MRINVYAEEISQDVEIVEKSNSEGIFTGIRMYLYLPVSTGQGESIAGKFIHHEGDDDSSAITFWGKQDMIPLLEKMAQTLRDYYKFKDRD